MTSCQTCGWGQRGVQLLHDWLWDSGIRPSPRPIASDPYTGKGLTYVVQYHKPPFPLGIQKTADLCGPTRERLSSRNLWAMCSACSSEGPEESKACSQRLNAGSVGLWKGVLTSVCLLRCLLLPSRHQLIPRHGPEALLPSLWEDDWSEGIWLAGGMLSLWVSVPQLKQFPGLFCRSWGWLSSCPWDLEDTFTHWAYEFTQIHYLLC